MGKKRFLTPDSRLKPGMSNLPPQKPTKITPAGTPFIKNARNGLATSIVSPTNGATSRPNSKNNNPKFRKFPADLFSLKKLQDFEGSYSLISYNLKIPVIQA